MAGCRHYGAVPVDVGEIAESYQPGICGICGALVDVRNGRPMKPEQFQVWVLDLLAARVSRVESKIYCSEVS